MPRHGVTCDLVRCGAKAAGLRPLVDVAVDEAAAPESCRGGVGCAGARIFVFEPPAARQKRRKRARQREEKASFFSLLAGENYEKNMSFLSGSRAPTGPGFAAATSGAKVTTSILNGASSSGAAPHCALLTKHEQREEDLDLVEAEAELAAAMAEAERKKKMRRDTKKKMKLMAMGIGSSSRRRKKKSGGGGEGAESLHGAGCACCTPGATDVSSGKMGPLI